MEIIIKETYEEVSQLAARMISSQLMQKPNSVLGLATGSTPIGTYRELVRMYREEGLDFSKVVTFNLDEYLGLPPTHPQSYRYFMNEHLFNHVNLPHANIHFPYGHVEAIEAFCNWYESQIDRYGGIDLQVLGVGSDGHIAFNEPGSSLGSRTRLKTLMEQTIQDNARFFDHIDEVPHFAITMGIGTILETKKILLLACGESKAEIIAQAVEGPITSSVTASALQLHRNTIMIVDNKAASRLTKTSYYRWVYEQKSRLLNQA